MGDKPTNPHDAYARAELTQADTLVAELQAVLPKPVAALIDWTVMERQSCSFIPQGLRSRYTDILFRTQCADDDAFLYFLVEHQSSPDPLMPFRMQEYETAIWNSYLEERERERKQTGGPPVTMLPFVLKVVVHASTDGRRWNAPIDIAEVLNLNADAKAALGELMPRSRFLLDDLNAIDVEALLARRGPAVLRVLLLMLKLAPRHDHLEQVLASREDDLRQLTPPQLRRLLEYISVVGDTKADALEPVIERIGPHAKETMMTIAEQLRTEGRAEGRIQGRTEGQAEQLIRQMSFKYGSLPERVAWAVREADAARLEVLSLRLLTASSLDELLAG